MVHRYMSLMARSWTGNFVNKTLSKAAQKTPASRRALSETSLRFGHAAITGPSKARSEDAWFCANGDHVCALGVSDGVGEWAKQGIDSGEFSRG